MAFRAIFTRPDVTHLCCIITSVRSRLFVDRTRAATLRIVGSYIPKVPWAIKGAIFLPAANFTNNSHLPFCPTRCEQMRLFDFRSVR